MRINHQNSLKRIKSFLSFYGLDRIFVFALLSTGILALCEASFPFIFKLAIDQAVYLKPMRIVLRFFSLITVLFIFWSFARFYSQYLFLLLAHRFEMRFKKFIFERSVYFRIHFFRLSRSGDILSRIMNDVESIEGVVARELKTLALNSGILFFCVLAMIFLDWKLFALLICMSLMGFFFLKLNSRHLTSIIKAAISKRGETASFLNEFLSCVHVVKASARELKERLGFERILSDYFIVKKSNSRLKTITQSLAEFSSNMIFLVFLAVSVVLIKHNKISLGTLVVFIYYLTFIRGRIGSMINSFIVCKQHTAVFYNVLDFTDQGEGVEDIVGGERDLSLAGKIEFRDVSFSYPHKDSHVLTNTTFIINPKDKVSAIGKSGCGKSTLLSLIIRFYDPTSGSILLDGRKIEEFNLSWLRSKIAFVFQDEILFNRSVAENIAYARLGATDTEIRKAAELSLAHDFIVSLPQGYETIVGERGVLISGGERQRLAIARAILARPDVLILDEATSCLSAEVESELYERVYSYFKDKTILSVSHGAPQLLRYSNKVLLFEDSSVRIVSPEDLYTV